MTSPDRRLPLALCLLGLLLAATAACAVLLTLGAGAAPASAAEACPNEQLRTGYAAALPDCRAYERVTPRGMEPQFESVNLSPQNVEQGREMPGEARGVWASLSGERLAFTSDETPPGSPSDGIYFMSKRGPDGWSTEDLIPPQSSEYGLVCYNAYTVAFTPELSSAVLADGYGQQGEKSGGLACGSDAPQLVEGEPQGYQNLFLRDGETGSYQLIDGFGAAPGGASPGHAWFQAASQDLSHVVFDEAAQLTPEAPAVVPASGPYGEVTDLYAWSAGGLRLVTFLPGGAPVAGVLANADEPTLILTYHGPELFTHAVSSDGSRVFWSTFEARENSEHFLEPIVKALYVRENATQPQSPTENGKCAVPADACTVQLDVAQAGAEGESGGGKFMWASTDGSKAFFTDESRLTVGSTAAAGKPDLYEYEMNPEVGKPGALVDLTPHAGEPADVQGLSGVSEEGDYVYIVAEGDLTGGQKNSAGAEAQAGQSNLYLLHAGTPTFIATLATPTAKCEGAYHEANIRCGGDWLDWNSRSLTARVSPNGQYMGFNSVEPLTKYDNSDVHSGQPDQEIYRYEAAQQKLVCVSCDPTGARPTAPAGIYESDHDWFGGGAPVEAVGYLQRNVLDDGRVFFDTAQSLVPQDTNGQYDVYEYQAGSAHLISTATSGEGSFFFESSPSGDDVFFLTAQELPAGKAEATYSAYDARVGGGFAEPVALTACSEEDCKGAFSAAPSFGAPDSATFAGTGNVVPPAPPSVAKTVLKRPVRCAKGRRRSHGRCVKVKRKKARSKRAGRAARGAGR